VPLIIGLVCLGVTIIGAAAAWSAPETCRVHLNDLGRRDAVPVPREEYERIRTAVAV
jgi:hypothetical protein